MKMEKTMKRIKVWRGDEVEWLADVFKCTTRTIYNALAGKRGKNSDQIRALALERGATEEP